MIYPSEVALQNSDIRFMGVDDWTLIGIDYEGGLWYYNTENDRRHGDGPEYERGETRNWHDIFMWAIRNPGEVEWFGYDESLERMQAREVNEHANDILQRENALRREQNMPVLLQNIPMHGF